VGLNNFSQPPRAETNNTNKEKPLWMFQILTFIEVSILAKMQIATFVEVPTFQGSIFGMMNPLSSEIFTPPKKKSSSYFNTISGLIYTYHQWAN
jgi:hypothetical protein